jgi:hypothetical protein
VNDYVESVNQYNAGKFDGVRHQHGCADHSGRRQGHQRARSWATIPTATTACCSRVPIRLRRSRASRSTWSSCRCRTICWRARWHGGPVAQRCQDGQHVGRRHRRRLSSPDAQAAVAWNPQLSVMRRQRASTRCSARPRCRARSSICWRSIPPRSRPIPIWARRWRASGMKPWR